MQQTTLDLIHDAYVTATKLSCINAVEVEENLMRILDTTFFDPEDVPKVDYFLDKVFKSILARRLTFQSTNLCTEVLHTAMYIVAWVNQEFKKEIDANITARRKALESELSKELELADNLNPTQIKDRFGIRFILLNKENGISLSCFLAKKIINILCSLNRTDRKDFLEYIENFDEDTKQRIKKLLDIPFVIEPLTRTDLLKKSNPKSSYPEDIEFPSRDDLAMMEQFNGSMKFYYYPPKWNGYQSIHFILGIDNNSEIMPGFQIELQFRTWKMHRFAENDINASHDAHKQGVADYTKVFTLSEEEIAQANICGFNSYKDTENDVDGIHYPKVFYNRRMNNISF